MPRARMASVLRCAEHTGNPLGGLEEISSRSRNADPPSLSLRMAHTYKFVFCIRIYGL
jgi:hypothetical protein